MDSGNQQQGEAWWNGTVMPGYLGTSIAGHQAVTATYQNLFDEMDEGPQWIYLTLIIVPLWIVFGNIMVLVAVYTSRQLQTLSNWVIASLAMTDFLLALIVVPFGIYQQITGSWQLGLHICILWTGSDVFLSTTSILHLCAIALHRCAGISAPFKARRKQEARHVVFLLLPTWCIGFTISLPLVIQGYVHRSPVLVHVNGGTLQCGIFQRTFAIYSSLVSFFIPLAVMVVADARSVQVLRRNSVALANGTRQRSSTNTTLMLSVPIKPSTTLTSSAAVVSSTTTTTTTTATTAVDKDTEFIRTSQFDNPRNMTPPPVGSKLIKDVKMEPIRKKLADRNHHNGKHKKKNRSLGYISILTRENNSSVQSTSSGGGAERRAERTLMWVFACFAAFWLPFFSLNLVYGVCGSEKCNIPDRIMAVCTWLGYLSSGVNPAIYTALNKDFRNAFSMILRCKQPTSAGRRTGPSSISIA